MGLGRGKPVSQLNKSVGQQPVLNGYKPHHFVLVCARLAGSSSVDYTDGVVSNMKTTEQACEKGKYLTKTQLGVAETSICWNTLLGHTCCPGDVSLLLLNLVSL